MRWVDEITSSMGEGKEQGGMVCCSSWNCRIGHDQPLNNNHNSTESACQCRRHRRHRFNSWVGKILWSKKWQPVPVFLPGKFHGQRSLAGYITVRFRLPSPQKQCSQKIEFLSLQICTYEKQLPILNDSISHCWSKNTFYFLGLINSSVINNQEHLSSPQLCYYYCHDAYQEKLRFRQEKVKF